MTPEQTKARRAAYYAANRDRILAKVSAYQAANREDRTAYKAAWAAKNQERIRAQKAQRYAERREEIRARQAKYYEENRDHILRQQAEYGREYWQTARGKIVAARRSAKRRATLRALPYSLTPTQWESIKAAYGQVCVYCGERGLHLTRDHFRPISLGGSTTMGNIVPACRRCNSRKGYGV